MTCYLTDETEPDELARGFDEGVWIAAKLYPAGATTNSASGVTDIRNIYPALERMERIGMVLCVHGEVTDPRSTCSIARRCSSTACSPGSSATSRRSRSCFEHITTAEAVQFVQSAGANVGATITPQHLLLNRNAFSPVDCGPTLIACRSPSARSTGSRCARPRPPARPNSSSAPTAPPTPAMQRNPPAAAPGSSTRHSRSKAMRRCSTRKASSTVWKRSRR